MHKGNFGQLLPHEVGPSLRAKVEVSLDDLVCSLVTIAPIWFVDLLYILTKSVGFAALKGQIILLFKTFTSMYRLKEDKVLRQA